MIQKNQFALAAAPGGTTTIRGIDGRGRRKSKVTGTHTTIFATDADRQPCRDVAAPGDLIQINEFLAHCSSVSFTRGGRLDACYYSLIERGGDGRFVGWIPDLPEVRAVGLTEDEVVRDLSRGLREHLRDMLMSGRPIPEARSVDELPRRNGPYQSRRLLLLIG